MRSSHRKINIAALTLTLFCFGLMFYLIKSEKSVRKFFLMSSEISTRILFSTRKDYRTYIPESTNEETAAETFAASFTYPDIDIHTDLLFDYPHDTGNTESLTSDENEEFEAGGEIIEEFYDKYSGENYINLPKGGQVRNLSELSNDEVLSLSESELPFEMLNNGEPEVLIIHTHTTETYEITENKYYNINRSTRSLSEEENMIAVGNVIADEIYKSGIGVIHDTTVHDYPDYNSAYDNSRKTVKNLLEKYPEIKVILDIHRDAIERDSSRISAVTTIDGKKAAQIMIICGYKDNSHYKENFKFASSLQSEIETSYPTLTRPVLFDYRFYNQDLSTGSLLIEIGSHGNTLDEAMYSGELVGKALGNLLKGS